MIFLTKLDVVLSQVRPLWFLLTYLTAIPTFGLLYTFVAPHGFYAPYARYEPAAASDTLQLASTLQAALHRSFDARAGQEFVVGNWRLDLDSLCVDDVKSTDGTQLSFRVRFTANGIGPFEGAQQLGWSIIATVSERPISAVFAGPNSVTVYHFPEADFSKYASPFKEDNENLFKLIFGQGNQGFGILAPALALNRQEDLQFRNYLQGIRGDPSSVSGHFWRMAYLSAVVITTLGLGDIVPITWQARILVASEAIAGIVLAGLFLNALAFLASSRPE
jgi:hypothetical protein